MGSSIIGGLIKSGYPAEHLFGVEPDKTKCKNLSAEFGINVFSSNQEAIQNCDVLVLAIKPQALIETLKPIKQFISTDCLIISIAAGITVDTIENCLTKNTAVIRVMPNTPSLINLGASGLFANQYASSNQKSIAELIMNSVGLSIWVDTEELIDVVTAISGSGPAYYFLFMEIFMKSAIKMGLTNEQAKELVQQTALGAANMAIESSETIEQLRKNVTSPGGTTEAAINSMLDDNIEKILSHALKQAEQRSKELAKLFEK